MNRNIGNTPQWMQCRVVFGATMDGHRVNSIEITGCQAVFDRSKDLGEQARAVVLDWVKRKERIHNQCYQDAQITYLEVTTQDGRFLDATTLGWKVLEGCQAAPVSAPVTAELESALIQAIEASGFSVSGATDSRVAENGEPVWVCNARAAIAQSAAARLTGEKLTELLRSTKFLVIDENTLCYRFEGSPNFLGVLAGSVLRGGRNPLDGMTVISPGACYRAATESDFERFRVSLPLDFVWEDGGCLRDRWDAGQKVLDRYVWPDELAIIGRRQWTMRSREQVHCFVDACHLEARDTSRDSGRVKLNFHVEFDKSGVVTKAYALDMDEHPVGHRGDVDTSTAMAS